MFMNLIMSKLNMETWVVSTTQLICGRDRIPLDSRLAGSHIGSSLDILRPRSTYCVVTGTRLRKKPVGYYRVADVISTSPIC